MLTSEQLAKSYAAGLTVVEIADCIWHMNYEQVRRGIVATGVRRRGTGPRPNVRMREYVGNLIDSGMDFTEIARQAGCSQSMVAKVARLKGW